MIKTARFKIHNPSRHKQAVLRYALETYHHTFKRVIEAALADPNLTDKASSTKDGVTRLRRFALSHYVRTLTPRNWILAQLRDYLVEDVTASLMSYLQKNAKGKNKANPPVIRALESPSQDSIREATEAIARSAGFEILPEQAAIIEKKRKDEHPRVAARMQAIFESRATTREIGKILRSMATPLPRPIRFDRCEYKPGKNGRFRGFLLARKERKFYLLVRLFSPHSKRHETVTLAPGFVDCRSGEAIDGKKYRGLVLPLECGREYHEEEFFTYGEPKAAQLMLRRDDSGNDEFYVHVQFEFKPPKLETHSVLGLDRGAAIIAAGTLLDDQGAPIQTSVNLQGAAFQQEMTEYRERIADLQRRGIQKHPKFKLRGRRADIVLGEYANKVLKLAIEHRAQIALEKLDYVAMNRYLRQSQFRRLHALLAYKAERAGLPTPLEVPAAYTSQTCAQCGHMDRANRVSQQEFRCTQCGLTGNADDNASHVIALRAVHQIQQGGRFQNFNKFQTWLKEMRRDGSPQATVGSP
jgi:hypothetical protein